MIYDPLNQPDDIRRRLNRDDDIEVQIRAVEEAAQFPELFAEEVVRVAERNTTTRYLVFERLVRFGAPGVEALKRAFNETVNDEVKTLSGLVLLHLDSPIGIAWLSEALLNDRNYACLIASYLMKAGVQDVEPIILQRLENFHADDPNIVLCLLDDLQDLNYPHLNELIQRMLAYPGLEKLHSVLRLREKYAK
jgi:hypothetical protein